MRPTVSEALDKLATQGSARQIADFLTAEGIKANPGDADRCAVAQYITRETGTCVTVFVGGILTDRVTNTHVRQPGGVEIHRGVPTAPLPTVIQEFAIGFDQLKYPDLIA